jgi:hypothetical protein
VRSRASSSVYCLLAALAASACSGSDRAPTANGAPAPKPTTSADNAASVGSPAGPCHPPRVQYNPYPGSGEGLSQLPWVRGEPPASGLVALLWYWPQEWKRRQLREALIFTGGVAPAGYNVKILWAFVAPSAKDRGGSQLAVEGERLGGPGAFREEFAAIGYAGQRGAPSYASVIDVPRPGCWRLRLTTGELSASVDLRAVRGNS